MENNADIHKSQNIIDEETFNKLKAKNISNDMKKYNENKEELKRLLKLKYKTIQEYDNLYLNIEIMVSEVLRLKRKMTKDKNAKIGYELKNGKYVSVPDEKQIIKNLSKFYLAKEKLAQ